jgi:serine/threonine-protein kinase
VPALSIDRYTIKRVLGQGAMGKVYLAEDPKLDRPVAIKVLATRLSDEEIRGRFRLEARAIAALKHPNIVELYDYSGKDAPDLYLVMEYVPGPSLYHLISQRGPMAEATALCVGHELALALEHAHSQQVVHRDLKPENVLLHQGRVVLTDFGVVKAVAENNALGVTAKTHTQILGTPGFMAPELFSGKNIDARADVFSLGAVLYNLSTARLPFPEQEVGAMLKRLRRGRFADAREHNPLLSAPFCKLMNRCLATKPSDRWPSVTQLREEILAVLELHGVTEVREELARYDKDPDGYAVAQRERALDVLVRDLKVALKDKDRARARTLVHRMKVLAPVEDRMRDITGVSLDANRDVVFTATARSLGRWGMLAGVSMGIVAGVALVTLLIAFRLLPDEWLTALLRWVP